MEVQWKETRHTGFWHLFFGNDVVLASVKAGVPDNEVFIKVKPIMCFKTPFGISYAKDMAVREVMKRHQETLDALAGLLLLGAECPHCGHALEGNEVNNDCNQCGQNMWKE